LLKAERRTVHGARRTAKKSIGSVEFIELIGLIGQERLDSDFTAEERKKLSDRINRIIQVLPLETGESCESCRTHIVFSSFNPINSTDKKYLPFRAPCTVCPEPCTVFNF
jgi:hypothetical protein